MIKKKDIEGIIFQLFFNRCFYTITLQCLQKKTQLVNFKEQLFKRYGSIKSTTESVRG